MNLFYVATNINEGDVSMRYRKKYDCSSQEPTCYHYEKECKTHCPPVDKDKYCDEILADAHELFAESDNCFTNAQIGFNEELVQVIYKALAIMRRVGYLEDKGVALDQEGNALIENSNCNFPSNKDDPRCKAILDKAIEQFVCEQEAQDKVVELLEEVLEQIKIGACCDAKGDDLIKEYEKCIHEKPCDWDCCCRDKYYHKTKKKKCHDYLR